MKLYYNAHLNLIIIFHISESGFNYVPPERICLSNHAHTYPSKNLTPVYECHFNKGLKKLEEC